MDVAARNCPFHVATSPATKLLPLIVISGGVEFTAAPAGDSDVIATPLAGSGSTVKVTAACAGPPPGPGLITVTCAEPGAVTSEASTVICSCPVIALKFVERAEPFQYPNVTPLPLEMNPVPEMKMVKSWLPAVMFDGMIALMAGVWLKGGALLPPHPAIASKAPASDASSTHRPKLTKRPQYPKGKDIKPVLL